MIAITISYRAVQWGWPSLESELNKLDFKEEDLKVFEELPDID